MKNLLVQYNENMDLNSALNFIFYNNDMDDYRYELDYLLQNVVFPKLLKDKKLLEAKNEKQSEEHSVIICISPK